MVPYSFLLSMVLLPSVSKAQSVSVAVRNPPASSQWLNGNTPLVSYTFITTPSIAPPAQFPAQALWDQNSTSDDRACTAPACSTSGQSSCRYGFDPANTLYSNSLPEGDWYLHTCIQETANPNNKGWSVTRFMTDNTPPPSPPNFRVTRVLNDEIDLAWDAPTDNSGIGVYHLSQNGSTVANLTATSFSDRGLVPGTTYSFQLVAEDNASMPNESAPVELVSLIVQVKNPPQDGIWLNTTRIVADYTFVTSPSSAPAFQYSTFALWDHAATSDNRGCSAALCTVVGQSSCRYSFDPSAHLYSNSLPEGDWYLHTCVQENSNLPNQGWSATHFMTDNTPPSIPAGLQASVSGTQINLSWQAATDNSVVAGYQIYRDAVMIGSSTVTNYSDSVSMGSNHSYAVAAFDAAQSPNVSPPSTPITIAMTSITLAVHNPPAPGVWLNGMRNPVNYSFDSSPSILNTSLFSTYASWDINPTNDNRACLLGSGFNTTQLLASNVIPEGNQYLHLCIKEVANPSNQGWSTTQFMTDNTAPSVPTGLTGSLAGQTQAQISWQPSSDNLSLAGYQIFRNGVQIATSTTTSYVDAGMQAGNNIYTIQAFDAVQSPNVSAPSTPFSLSFVATSSPTVSIVQPIDQSTSTAGGDLQLIASASSAGGLIQQVSFAANGVNLGLATTIGNNQFKYSWASVSSGTYIIVATAQDNLGAMATSSITVTVGDAGATLQSITGIFQLVVQETHNGSTQSQYSLSTDSESLHLTFDTPGLASGVPPNATVQVDGYRSGMTFNVTNGTGGSGRTAQTRALTAARRPIRILATPPAAGRITSGVRKVLILLVDFQNDSNHLFSAASVRASADDVNNFYQENSSHQFSMQADIFGYVTLPINETCDFDTVVTAGKQKASNMGIDLTQYQSYVFVGEARGCLNGYASIGTPGDNTVGSVLLMSIFSTPSLAHELGHNLGLLHANAWDCGNRIYALDGSCNNVEYGNLYDVMSDDSASPNLDHLDAEHKEILGWLNAQLVTQSGLYSIYPLESSDSRPRALKIFPASASDRFYFEYRQPIGYDAPIYYKNIFGGTLVNEGGDPTSLLNMHPTNNSPIVRANAALLVGEKYTDPGNRFAATVLSSSSLSLQLRFLVPGVNSPTVAITSPADGTNVSGTVTIGLDALDRSGISKIELYKDGTLLTTLTAAPYTYDWSAQNETPGPRVILAKVYNSSGNSSTQQITLNVASGLSIALTAPPNTASFTTGTSVTLGAHVTNTTGQTPQVQFLSGTTVLGTATGNGPDYSFIWTAGSPGLYTIGVQATLPGGSPVLGTPVSIAVVNPGGTASVGLTLSPAQTTYFPGMNLTVNARVLSDSTNGIASLVLSGLIFSACPGTTCQVTMPICCSGAIGQPALSETVTAFDAQGNALASQTIPIDVEGPATVAIASPSDHSSFKSGTPITFNATTYAVGGSITSVDFYAGGQLVATTSAGSSTGSAGHQTFSATWNNIPTSIYSIVAKANTNNGQSGLSQPISIGYGVVDYVPPPPPPPPPSGPPPADNIDITSPQSGSTFVSGQNIPLFAQTTSPDFAAKVASVQFGDGNTILGTGTLIGGGGYSFNWLGAAAGSHSLVVQANLVDGSFVRGITPIPITVQAAVSFPNLAPNVAMGSTIGAAVNVPMDQIQWTLVRSQSNGILSAQSIGDTWGVASGPGVYSVTTTDTYLNLSQFNLLPGQYHLSALVRSPLGGLYPPAEANITLVGSDLNGARVHPNPWRSDIHTGYPITFDQLAAGSSVKIFTLAGRWVKTLSAPDGVVTWDLTNDDGNPVASGIYFYLITSNGQKYRGKLGIVR